MKFLRSKRSGGMRALAIAGVAALALTACGGDDDPGGEADPTDGGTTDGATAGAADCGEGPEATGLLAELQERDSITIGVADEAPFGYVGDDGEPTGAAPDVARAVLCELGISNMEAQVVEFGALIGGLQAQQFDLIAAGMYINPERAEQILFSDPDYCITESLAVAEGNPLGIVDYQSVAENPEITLAVATGTVEVGYAEQAGIPDSQLSVFANIDGMYAALEAGEVDAVTGTSATVRTETEAREGIEGVTPFFPKDADGEEILPCGGYGFRNENQDFRDAFNEVLNEMRADGTTIEIITEYPDFAQEDIELANTKTLEDFLE